jgi:replicative DNA helicase
VQLGYGGNEGDVGGGEVDEIVDRAQAEIYEVTERRTSEDYVIPEELLQPTMDEIDAIAMAGGQAAGVPTGFADLDNLTNGLHPGQMIIVAARPGIGKSTLALDIARHAAVKHRKTAVIFSLEMSKTEITMRLLSAEAGIRLSQMRSGSMSEQDWQKIVRRMTEISDALLNRTYVILVLPKCLLTWGYVKVDPAAFCLQHDDRHGESAGPVEI